jgi:hypothetical protein
LNGWYGSGVTWQNQLSRLTNERTEPVKLGIIRFRRIKTRNSKMRRFKNLRIEK